MDDHSGNFGSIRHSLTHRDGRSYKAFVAALKPRYRQVYLDILLGYVGLVASLAAVVALEGREFLPWLAAIPASVSIGFFLANLELFLHEAGHFNIHPRRSTNDLIANLVIGWLSGAEVKSYRALHWNHHRDLGKTTDTESTYFHKFDAIMLLKLLCGIHALRTLQKKFKTEGSTIRVPKDIRFTQVIMVIFGLAVHFAILISLGAHGFWASFVAWLIGNGAFFPFFSALRQILEHRSFDASGKEDYFSVDHGAVARLFEDGLFSRFFGGAGFNRHLLHHYEPQISYTALPDYEEFLAGTQLGEVLQRRRTTYAKAFRTLLAAR